MGDMDSRSAIVGIVGKTLKREDELTAHMKQVLEWAEEIGDNIAHQRHIVLTGGHLDAMEDSVKYRALLGARRVADAGSRARLIGILPKGLSNSVGWKRDPGVQPSTKADLPLRYFYLHTGLDRHERNLITGGAPDVLIALHGEEGTAEEVSAALEAKRTVIFLRSYDQIKGFLLAGGSSLPDPRLEVDTPEDALREALTAWKLPRASRVPALWVGRNRALHAKYQNALRDLQQQAPLD